ncbi:TPA: glycosyltransferase [Citrobacter freundii]
MSIFNEAITLYRKKDYAQALQMFELAGEQYGKHLVEVNLHMCRKALGTNFVEAKALTTPSIPKVDVAMDAATRLMLANGNLITVDETERQELLTQYRNSTARKSEDAVVRTVNPIPSDWPKDLVLPPLGEGTNDYKWNASRKKRLGIAELAEAGLSVIIPTFNRAKILDITLACLLNQKTNCPYEVIVVDDGSREQIVDIVKKYEKALDIKYIRHPDDGFRVSTVRNFGLNIAKYDFVAFLDCDMAPCTTWIQSYMEILLEDNDIALIGPRKYIDTSSIPVEKFLNDAHFIDTLPEVMTNNLVAGKIVKDISVDWRLEHFKKSDNLRLCDSPFRYFAAGNIAFAKKWIKKTGGFDENFENWGGEDVEFGYRLYREGCFFKSVIPAMAYHQEPPGKENETDRAAGKAVTQHQMKSRIPYFYRKPLKVEDSQINKKPLVSIYIPAYNCRDSIVRCVTSALNQTIVDLEVCICDDGSTDDTLSIINSHFKNHPRVKIVSKENGGIGSASNTSVKICSGYYIGQLDSDDYLEPDAVELCLREFLLNKNLACVYATYRNVNPDGTLHSTGYNWPVYSREKLMTAMIAHHFRMFTIRAWKLTAGFNEKITNAVDYDMFLKLSEIGPFKHVNKILYNRVLHGNNTSIKKIGEQKENHFIVVSASFNRIGIKSYKYVPVNINDPACRKYTFEFTNN